MSGSAAWESVYDQSFDKMDRLPVDGGHIYRNRTVTSGSAQDPQHYVWMVAMTFVPEPATPLLTAAERATRRHPQ